MRVARRSLARRFGTRTMSRVRASSTYHVPVAGSKVDPLASWTFRSEMLLRFTPGRDVDISDPGAATTSPFETAVTSFAFASYATVDEFDSAGSWSEPCTCSSKSRRTSVVCEAPTSPTRSSARFARCVSSVGRETPNSLVHVVRTSRACWTGTALAASAASVATAGTTRADTTADTTPARSGKIPIRACPSPRDAPRPPAKVDSRERMSPLRSTVGSTPPGRASGA